jgi:hypothetical protein
MSGDSRATGHLVQDRGMPANTSVGEAPSGAAGRRRIRRRRGTGPAAEPALPEVLMRTWERASGLPDRDTGIDEVWRAGTIRYDVLDPYAYTPSPGHVAWYGVGTHEGTTLHSLPAQETGPGHPARFRMVPRKPRKDFEGASEAELAAMRKKLSRAAKKAWEVVKARVEGQKKLEAAAARKESRRRGRAR